MMKKTILMLLILLTAAHSAVAQDRKVQNRPYTDLRNFHFGIHIGTHIQDVDFMNVGPQTITNEEGVTTDYLITTDQDRWDPGFNVGVLGEFRLNTNFQLRVAPAIYFGSRHLTYLNHLATEDSEGHKTSETRQNIKAAYVLTSVDLIFAAPRFNNTRPYMFAGIVPSLDLTGKTTDYVKLNNYQTFAEVGIGLDNYLPYFKCRPELKFMFGLGNALDTNHAKDLRDKNSIAYANSVSKATTRMITLSFYFE